ncbi:MAG: methyl-accepting chemotaxis protein [Oscillospiraceae bacterium]
MKFNSIKTKILSITISLLLLSLSAVTIIFAIFSVYSTEATVEELFGETASTAALAVENRLVATKNTIQEIGAINRLSNPESTPESRQEILNSKIEKYGFQKIIIVNANGVTDTGVNLSDQRFFKRALNGETFIEHPMLGASGKSAEIMVSAPLWKDGLYGTRVVGVVVGVIDGSFLSDITNKISIGETGQAYIVNAEGTTIADKDYNLVLSGENSIEQSKTDASLTEFAKVDKAALEGKATFGKAKYNGVDNFIYSTPIAGTTWALGVFADQKEFMGMIYTAVYICIAIAAVLLVLSIIVMVGFSNKIIKPIKQIEKAVQEVAKGNFDVEVTHKSRDELGIMADALRQMISATSAIINDTSRGLSEMARGNFDIVPTVEYVGVYKKLEDAIVKIIISLSETLGSIKLSAEQVSSGSDQVASGAQALSQGATEQASAIEELSATIAEMSHQIEGTAGNAQKANGFAQQAGVGVSSGNEKMNEMIVAMSEISSKSNEIGKIIKTIDDIAFQTNILALNAAVEAARAGSAGKGFAVVADEVRNLAQKSAEAAKNTTALIEGSITAVAKGTQIADDTAKALEVVVEKSSQVTDIIAQISTASATEAEGARQVTIGVDQISSVVQTNSATAEESAAASEELSSQAQLLNDLVSKFRLKDLSTMGK